MTAEDVERRGQQWRAPDAWWTHYFQIMTIAFDMSDIKDDKI